MSAPVHTPTPWSVDGDSIIAPGYGRLASVPYVRPLANAEFIVRACNAHDDLVAALHEARAWIKHVWDVPIAGGQTEIVNRIDDALTRAWVDQ